MEGILFNLLSYLDTFASDPAWPALLRQLAAEIAEREGAARRQGKEDGE